MYPRLCSYRFKANNFNLIIAFIRFPFPNDLEITKWLLFSSEGS